MKEITSSAPHTCFSRWCFNNPVAHAKAVYSYTANNSDELSFSEGETLTIVDATEDEWWKAERDGAIYIVPAGYLEVAEG